MPAPLAGAPRRLRPIRVALPTKASPVVECCWAAPCGAEACHTAAQAHCDEGRRKKSSAERWSTTAVVDFHGSSEDCSSEASSPRAGSAASSTSTAPARREDDEPEELRGECPPTLPYDGGPWLEELQGGAGADGGPDARSRGVAIFLRSAKGGEGLPRCRGRSAEDEFHDSLFEAAAREIAASTGADCCHVAWPRADMDIGQAVDCVLDAVVLAAARALRVPRRPDERHPSRLRVFLIGHAFGGAVAAQAAGDLAWLFREVAVGPLPVTVEGLCTFNAEAGWDKACLQLGLLREARALLVASQQVGAPGPAGAQALMATRELFAALPLTRKEMLVMPEGPCQAALVPLLVDFVRGGLLAE